MMIASPIAASAAATAITNSAGRCPMSTPWARAKARKVRLLALSISSTHMKTTSALRRTSTPNTPREKRRAARIRKFERGIELFHH